MKKWLSNISWLRSLEAPRSKAPRSRAPRSAYNLWAATYDNQPNNLMLKLDAEIFNGFLSSTQIKGKIIVDIGCGTGRHWEKILAADPKQLIGFDVSEEMLSRLKLKYPQAEVYQDENLSVLQDCSCDVIISTLTIAHMPDLESTLNEWIRKLKPSAEVIITDLHPDSLIKGGKRTFEHNGESVNITNYIHKTADIKKIFERSGFNLIGEETRNVDASVKKYYEDQHALHIYQIFQGVPIIFGLHLKREDDIA